MASLVFLYIAVKDHWKLMWCIANLDLCELDVLREVSRTACGQL